jgi:hypothetical protein
MRGIKSLAFASSMILVLLAAIPTCLAGHDVWTTGVLQWR